MSTRPLVLAALVIASGSLGVADERHALRYDEPASFFEETLLIGNGRSGAAVYGGVLRERLHLNDLTLWTGRPVDPNMNPNAHEHLPDVRAALARGDFQAADQLVRALQGKFSESYAPLGDLVLELGGHGEPEDYERVLDLASATEG